MWKNASRTFRKDHAVRNGAAWAAYETFRRETVAEDVSSFQKGRLDAGVSGRTVNMETGVLRRMLKRAKVWNAISEDVQALPQQQGAVAKVLTPDLKRKLFECPASTISWSKTAAGHRTIPLNGDAMAALARLLERTSALGSNEPEYYVFPACDVRSVNPSRLQKSWRTAWRKLVGETARRLKNWKAF